MKSIRKEAALAQSEKLRRLGAQGNLSAAEKAIHAKRKYASGGSVSDPMPGVEGSAPKARLDRASRGGAKAKKGTNVNVVIMQHPQTPSVAGPAGAAAIPAVGNAPHPMVPIVGPPATPVPVPAGGPPMRKNGGAVGKFAKGGSVKVDAGAGSGVGRLEKIGKKI